MKLKSAVDALLKALLFFAVYFFWSIVIGSLVSGVDVYILSMLMCTLTMLTYIVMMGALKKSFTKELSLTGMSHKDCIMLILFGISMNVVITVLFSLIPFPEAWVSQYTSASESLGAVSPLMVIYTVVFAPFTEEAVFRGMVHGTLRRGMPTVLAAILSSLLFGIMHGALIWIIYASVLGLLMCFIFEKYSSLSASVLFHTGFNAGGVLLSLIYNLSLLLIAAAVFGSTAMLVYLIKTPKEKLNFSDQGDKK